MTRTIFLINLFETEHHIDAYDKKVGCHCLYRDIGEHKRSDVHLDSLLS